MTHLQNPRRLQARKIPTRSTLQEDSGENPQMENHYKNKSRSPDRSRIVETCRKMKLDARSVDVWFKRRRNTDRPSREKIVLGVAVEAGLLRHAGYFGRGDAMGRVMVQRHRRALSGFLQSGEVRVGARVPPLGGGLLRVAAPLHRREKKLLY